MAFIANTVDNRWHGYILLSEAPTGWDNSQRQNANDALHGVGKQSGAAHLKTHGRVNLNNTAWLNESSYTEEELTRDYQVQVLAEALDISSVAVDAKVNYQIFADGGTWQESRDVANQYIANNIEEWESAEAL